MKRPLIVVDLFAGAGGATRAFLAAAAAIGLAVELVAINHNPAAVATHHKNFPGHGHFCQNVESVAPWLAVPKRFVDFLLAGPECVTHSRAKGKRKRTIEAIKRSRTSAFEIIRWCEECYIQNVLIENVVEWLEWGPVDSHGEPIKALKGRDFRLFVSALEELGYEVQWRILNAADFGDATTRRRVFLQATRRGHPCWPVPTHVDPDLSTAFPERTPWLPASSIIRWDILGTPISTRKKKLVASTMGRVKAGLVEFCGLTDDGRIELAKAQAFTVGVGGPRGQQVARALEEGLRTILPGGHQALCVPFLVKYHGGEQGAGRVHSVDEPMRTVDTSNRFWLATPFLVKYYGGHTAELPDEPLRTITAQYEHLALCAPFLVKYNGTGGPVDPSEPLDTVTTKERFGLALPLVVTDEHGQTWLLDVLFRMLRNDELAAAQGFPADYQFVGTQKQITAQIGNAWAGHCAQALIGAMLARPGAILPEAPDLSDLFQTRPVSVYATARNASLSPVDEPGDLFALAGGAL